MKKLWFLSVLLLAGCASHPVDPFAPGAVVENKPHRREKIRRPSFEPSYREDAIVHVPSRELSNGKIRAVFYVSPEDTLLYPDVTPAQLLALDVVPNVDLHGSELLKRVLADKRTGVNPKDVEIFIPRPPPGVIRLSGRAYPIVVEGSREVMEKVAFHFALINRMMRIYDLTLDGAGIPIDDTTLDKIRDISDAKLDALMGGQ